MKTAVIFYKGEEVTRFEHDLVTHLCDVAGNVLVINFNLKGEQVAFFTGDHCYVII